MNWLYVCLAVWIMANFFQFTLFVDWRILIDNFWQWNVLIVYLRLYFIILIYLRLCFLVQCFHLRRWSSSIIKSLRWHSRYRLLEILVMSMDIESFKILTILIFSFISRLLRLAYLSSICCCLSHWSGFGNWFRYEFSN